MSRDKAIMIFGWTTAVTVLLIKIDVTITDNMTDTIVWWYLGQSVITPWYPKQCVIAITWLALTLFTASGLAPLSRSSAAACSCPSNAAICSGVAPLWSHILVSYVTLYRVAISSMVMSARTHCNASHAARCFSKMSWCADITIHLLCWRGSHQLPSLDAP